MNTYVLIAPYAVDPNDPLRYSCHLRCLHRARAEDMVAMYGDVSCIPGVAALDDARRDGAERELTKALRRRR